MNEKFGLISVCEVTIFYMEKQEKIHLSIHR